MAARRIAPVLIGLLVFATSCQLGGGGDLLSTIESRGRIVVATDPAYPPQSEQLPDGSFEGFDIDVANEIGERMGVDVEFATPNFDEVVAGNWAGRFDISVGSVTITEERQAVLDFTEAYYFTPAQFGATEESGITDIEGIAGTTVCVGAATTYQSWLEGSLTLVGSPEPDEPPENVEVTTFDTDTECADAIVAGRTDFEVWLTASETLKVAIDEGAPFVPVGDPVFFEALAVAVDKEGPAHAELLEELDRIIAEMHEDGTLTELSQKWYDGQDLTKAE